MSDQNVIQEPSNLKELLYVKSLPILNKMLGPDVDGTPAKNYRIVGVRWVNAGTVVDIEQTTDVSIDIDTAKPEQIVTRAIPYNRYHIGDVFRHYLGAKVFGGEPPKNETELKTWLAERTDKLAIDDSLYVEYGPKYISIRPTDEQDLKWHGVVFLNFQKPSSDNGDGEKPVAKTAHAGLVQLNITADSPLSVESKDGTVNEVTTPTALIENLRGEGYTVTVING